MKCTKDCKCNIKYLFGRAKPVTGARSIEHAVRAEYDLYLALVRPKGLNKGRNVISKGGVRVCWYELGNWIYIILP